jgi:hypothetical protein
MNRIEVRKRDLMSNIYNTLYTNRIRNTTYFQILEYLDICYFYIQNSDVLWEYKKYLFYKSCMNFGLVRNGFLSREEIILFLENRNNERPIDFNSDVIDRV